MRVTKAYKEAILEAIKKFHYLENLEYAEMNGIKEVKYIIGSCVWTHEVIKTSPITLSKTNLQGERITPRCLAELMLGDFMIDKFTKREMPMLPENQKLIEFVSHDKHYSNIYDYTTEKYIYPLKPY